MRTKLAIALLAFSLAMLSANSAVKRLHHFLHPQKQTEESSFFPFSLTPQSSYIKVYENAEEEAAEKVLEEENLQQTKEFIKPVLKLELTDEEKQTIEYYAQNAKLRDFITELSGVVSQEDLNQENYLKIAFNPEVRSIFMKYTQDEEFRNIATSVMKDKNALELAKKIIQNNEVQK